MCYTVQLQHLTTQSAPQKKENQTLKGKRVSIARQPQQQQKRHYQIMSLRGVRQLKELVVRYSDLDGSSRGVREWMRTNIVELASTNPELTIKTELKRAVHPFLRGIYKNGNTKTICIKNISSDEVHKYALHLRNQIGRKISNNGYKRAILSDRPSLQGEWHERMDLVDLDLTITHHK